MRRMIQKNDGYYRNISWLILFILVSSVLISCSGTRSIRSGNSYYQIKSKKEIQKPLDVVKEVELNDDSLLTEMSDHNSFESTPPQRDYTKLADIVGNRLPTIREQMQELSRSQDTIRDDIVKMQSDIEQIKHILSDLKGTIDDYIPYGTRVPATGKPISSNNTENKKENSYQLLSDEKTVNKPSKESKQKVTKKAISETFLHSDESTKPKQQAKPQVVEKSPVKEEIAAKNEGSENSENYLNQGKQLYKNQNYAAAIDNLKKALLEETSKKQESEINYYLGESYYFLNNFDLAVEYLNKVLSFTDSAFLDAARIRKAEANLKAGNVKEAKADYQALIRNHPGSSHIPKARKMLQQL